MIALQSLVRFAHPESGDEARERFTVLELRGDRALVELPACGAPHAWAINPTFVYLLSDLQECHP